MDKTLVGWREWVALPELGIPAIKAKMDTGARTSCLHAFEVEAYSEKGAPFVRFKIHPLQHRDDIVKECFCEVTDRRYVTDSGGHKELRYVIVTRFELGKEAWPIEMTLKNRDTMKFRALVGRTAMRGRMIVNPAASFLHGRVFPDTLTSMYPS